MHPQSLPDLTGKGQAAYSERCLLYPHHHLILLPTVTFIALVDTAEGEAENVTPTRRRQERDMPTKTCHLIIMVSSCGLALLDSFGRD